MPARNGVPTLYPGLAYKDARAAIAWLGEAFGFEELLVVPGPDNSVAHAELKLGNGVLMLGSVRPEDTGTGQRTPYIYVADLDAHHDRAKAAGAEITVAPHDNDYGGRGYTARDLGGTDWHVGSYKPAL